MHVTAIIVAGGRGARFGGDVPKQFLALAGRPMIEWSIEAFQAASSITSIIVVVPEDQVSATQLLLAERYTKIAGVVAGGARRQDSMARGVRAAATKGTDLIAVHDAARPLILPALINQCVAKAQEWGGAIVALPARDTIKRVTSAGAICETIPRTEIWQAQTPQIFQREILERAIALAHEQDATGTDESSLVEALGERVMVVAGDAHNMKVTTADDWPVAERLLLSRDALSLGGEGQGEGGQCVSA